MGIMTTNTGNPGSGSRLKRGYSINLKGIPVMPRTLGRIISRYYSPLGSLGVLVAIKTELVAVSYLSVGFQFQQPGPVAVGIMTIGANLVPFRDFMM